MMYHDVYVYTNDDNNTLIDIESPNGYYTNSRPTYKNLSDIIIDTSILPCCSLFNLQLWKKAKRKTTALEERKKNGRQQDNMPRRQGLSRTTAKKRKSSLIQIKPPAVTAAAPAAKRK